MVSFGFESAYDAVKGSTGDLAPRLLWLVVGADVRHQPKRKRFCALLTNLRDADQASQRHPLTGTTMIRLWSVLITSTHALQAPENTSAARYMIW